MRTAASTTTMYLADRSLAQRLERAEANASTAYVESRARLDPLSDATWIDVAGAYAMFDGLDSPLTQTFGLGLFEPVTDAVLDALETFYQERSAEVFHEVSPLAGNDLLPLLTGRGYTPVEFTSVLFRPIDRSELQAVPASTGVETRPIAPNDGDLWAGVSAQGWSEYPEVATFMQEFGRISARSRGTTCFLAEVEGVPIATGALAIHNSVALLAGASTVPKGRRQGAQLALLEARLRYAAKQGCDLAMMGAEPGSASQRNAERQGFRIAYTRVKWRLSC